MTAGGSATAATVGVDVGGTFTDVVVSAGAGRDEAVKVLTTPADPLVGVRRGLRLGLARAGVAPGEVGRLVHGTTLATNVILERRGARVAFVTTAGFGDLFRLGHDARVEEDRYDLLFQPPRPPLEHDLTFEAPERTSARGEPLTPLTGPAAAELAARVAAAGPEAVAVCFLHSWANPEHERVMARELRAALPPGTHVAISADVSPELREYERGMTTLLSAYVGPVMSRYLSRLRQVLADEGLAQAAVYVMDSAGGVMSTQAAAVRPILTIESGGAAGVVAAGQIGRAGRHPRVLSFDMGGTTAKMGLVRDGQPTVTHSFEVSGKGSFGVARSGSGLPVRTPVVDLAEVGAGGGSIAWVDPTGALRVGPHSAGAEPGPACYGRGGTQPTVTDANLVLGYLDPAGLADGVALDRARAEEALRRGVAEPLGIADLLAAAHAVHDVAVATMAAAIRVVTVQRGEDPRDYTMVAFGGAGPMFAARLAAAFGITDVVVPPSAGVGSAVGLLHADLAVERVRTRVLDPAGAPPDEVKEIFHGLEADAVDALALGAHDQTVTLRYSVDLRYRGQAHQLTVPVTAPELAEPGLPALLACFREVYRATYGVTLDAPCELVSYRVRATRPFAGPAPGAQPDPPVHQPEPDGARTALFAEAGAPVPAAVFRYERLAPGALVAGPAFVDGAESTTLVPPGALLRVDATGTLHIQVAAATTGQAVGPA
ncbi:MAG: hydantoinase/oxoprolinase family protein [Frankia sp.]|nr:hydantoinase/oxoprolinase family protein [Frankia sp.]